MRVRLGLTLPRCLAIITERLRKKRKTWKSKKAIFQELEKAYKTDPEGEAPICDLQTNSAYIWSISHESYKLTKQTNTGISGPWASECPGQRNHQESECSAGTQSPLTGNRAMGHTEGKSEDTQVQDLRQ